MDIEEVRSLIVARIQCTNQSNRHYLNHLEGQIRALVAVITGEPPTNAHGDMPTYLRAAGIPFEVEGDEIGFDETWLRAHGFDIGKRGEINHPRWSRRWW